MLNLQLVQDQDSLLGPGDLLFTYLLSRPRRVSKATAKNDLHLLTSTQYPVLSTIWQSSTKARADLSRRPQSCSCSTTVTNASKAQVACSVNEALHRPKKTAWRDKASSVTPSPDLAATREVWLLRRNPVSNGFSLTVSLALSETYRSHTASFMHRATASQRCDCSSRIDRVFEMTSR